MRITLCGLLLFAGCAPYTRQVKVIKSDTEIRVLRLSVEEGDVIACDNTTCRTVAK